MQLEDLRYFRAVAETRSFGRGARASHISAPAVSKAVQRLERELGTKLFDRTTRRVALTDAGVILLGRCQRVFEELVALEADLGIAETVPRGELRIGAMEVFSVQLLPRAIVALVREHPDVVPIVYEMIPERMIRALEEGRLDIAFTIGARQSPGIRIRSLGRTRGALVCGRSHPLYRRGRIRERDLELHPFVVPRFWEAEHLPPLDQFPEEQHPRRVGATIELLQMEVELVTSGTYLGFLPEISILRELRDGSLRALVGLGVETHFELQVLSREGTAKPATERLLEAAREVVSQKAGRKR
jgi:DNA-binding transcriptional LysR family regulator